MTQQQQVGPTRPVRWRWDMLLATGTLLAFAAIIVPGPYLSYRAGRAGDSPPQLEVLLALAIIWFGTVAGFIWRTVQIHKRASLNVVTVRIFLIIFLIIPLWPLLALEGLSAVAQPWFAAMEARGITHKGGFSEYVRERLEVEAVRKWATEKALADQPGMLVEKNAWPDCINVLEPNMVQLNMGKSGVTIEWLRTGYELRVGPVDMQAPSDKHSAVAPGAWLGPVNLD